MLLKIEFLLAVLAMILAFTNAARTKRMYALCPPKFIRIGNECYYISKEKVSWLDAHFECKDRNSRLAEPIKFEDKALRKYFIKSDSDHTEKWLGCIYNWEKNKWQWGYNGRDLSYQSFSQMIPGSRQDLKFHCAVLNPNLKYRWSARSCVDKHAFVCQHRMPYVNANNRQKIYDRWNTTYPNQIANEIEVLVAEGGNTRKNQTRRSRPEGIHPTRYGRRNNIRNNNVLDDNSIQESRVNNRLNKKRKHHNFSRTQDQPQNDGQLIPTRSIHSEIGYHGYPIVETISDDAFNEIRNNTATMQKPQRRRPRKHRRKTTTTPATTTTEQLNSDLNESFDQMNRIDELQRAHVIEKERMEQENLRYMEEKRRDEEQRLAQEKRFLEEQRREVEEAERKILYEEEIRKADQDDKKIKYQNKEDQQNKEEESRLREEQMRRDEEQLRKEEEQLRRNDEQKKIEINKRIEEERSFREKEEKKLDDEQKLAEEKRFELNTKTDDEFKSITEIPKVEPHISVIDKLAEEKRLRREKLKERLRNLSPEKQAEFFNRRKDRMNNKNGDRKNNESIIPE